jgi:glycosyltransferase involved in cell wall biosynthesis
MTPFFSIITPSLQRESLVRCCDSITSQIAAPLWEHIVIIDNAIVDADIIAKCLHSNRLFLSCGTRHNNFGNTCRHAAWERATGTYCLYVDDDNYLAHPDVLADIGAAVLGASFPDWAIFPIHRHGSIFFYNPPGLCFTDTLNIVVKREIGRWPDIAAREADGHFVEKLKTLHPNYVAFPDVRPIGVMEYSSNGK